MVRSYWRNHSCSPPLFPFYWTGLVAVVPDDLLLIESFVDALAAVVDDCFVASYGIKRLKWLNAPLYS